MPEAKAGIVMDRRTLLPSAVMLVGGSLAGGLPTQLLAASTRAAPIFFAAPQFAMLDEIAEIVIPRTDTPGAREVGVAGFVDALMAHWASSENRREIAGEIGRIDEAARRSGAAGLLALAPEKRVELVRAHDAAAFASDGWGWRKLKELILIAYYWSETGATQELRYELAPGVWEAKVPIGPDTRAWAL